MGAYPTEAELRKLLLDRVQRYCELTGMSKSALGLAIAKDKTLFSDIANGRNFKIGTYADVMNWLDTFWPEAAIK